MTKEQLIEKQVAFFTEGAEYYMADPNRRCRLPKNCAYHPKTVGKEGISEGCFVGRKLSEELALKLDRECAGASACYDPVFEQLPDELKELGASFLRKCQTFHDWDNVWDEPRGHFEKYLTQIKAGTYA